jgi:hypothetical protein
MKLCNVTLRLQKEECPAVKINQIDILQTSVSYLGLHLDNKLIWRNDTEEKRKQVDQRVKEMN